MEEETKSFWTRHRRVRPSVGIGCLVVFVALAVSVYVVMIPT